MEKDPEERGKQAFTNRLAQEKSPYLLQHAHNPVDWFPWGNEAIQKSKSEGKPIFLSIGYSTCHWCHVMEEESFSDTEIAGLLNQFFVPVKVDREERPDIDHIYMQAVTAMTGMGGWPLSVFLTPDQQPFYGGTYFPPRDMYGRPGFKTVLEIVAQKWKEDQKQIAATAESMVAEIVKHVKERTAVQSELDEKVLHLAFEQFASQFSQEHGGFGSAPKFPSTHVITFLLRYWKRTGNDAARKMAEKTLEEMGKGGIFDHLGGGFHRYSTDDNWHVPHFEKMLYDQALISRSYLEAYQASEEKSFAHMARRVFDYVLTELRHPLGYFYSAEDADSADPNDAGRKKEGVFYIWSFEEVVAALGQDEAAVFNYYFDIEAGGNVLSDPHDVFGEKNVLHVIRDVEETARRFSKSPDEVERILGQAKEKLLLLRSKRPKPHLDDKMLVDWNGLMISSLAFGSMVLGDSKYVEAARSAADFIIDSMKNEYGRLMHQYRDGVVAVPGFLNDYAFFILGLLDLYEATFEVRYLEEADDLAEEMIRLFYDDEEGGFYFSGLDNEHLIMRPKELFDGAIPSGNSVATATLLRLSRMTMNKRYQGIVENTFKAFGAELAKYPSGFAQMLQALDFLIGPAHEIVVAGKLDDIRMAQILNEVYSHFLPNKVVIFHGASERESKAIEGLSPFIKKYIAVHGEATAYVCRNFVCALPTSNVLKLRDLLQH